MRHGALMNLFAVKWYEYAGHAQQWEAFWRDLAAYLPVDEPTFHKGPTDDLWGSQTYALTWACGGDVALYPDLFTPVAVPAMGTPTQPGQYHSLILARAHADMAHADRLKVGINYASSLSGHLALADWWHGQGWARPTQVCQTGGHEASVQALLRGQVDLIALDSQGINLLYHAYPALKSCQAIGKTKARPAPPLCRPKGAGDFGAWQKGFARARTALKAGTLDARALGIRDLLPVNRAPYDALASDLKAQIANNHVLADGTEAVVDKIRDGYAVKPMVA